MTNSVRRPRRHPRVESVAWVSFGWLLRRTAAFAVVEPAVIPQLHAAWRRYLAESSASHVERFVALRLAKFPHLGQVREFRG